MIFRNITFTTTIAKQCAYQHSDALHVIIPHCLNWRLTESCVRAFSRLTKKRVAITIVNNFDIDPVPQAILEDPNVTLIHNRFTLLGKFLNLVRKTRNGSEENALALDTALRLQSRYEWAFMAHSDSAPLVPGWDEHYFSALQGGHVLGNYRDRIRIHAAHASGTLFHQKKFMTAKASMRPEVVAGRQRLDVGDRATVVLHGEQMGPVPVLPNTINTPDLIETIQARFPLLASLAKDGSCITLDRTSSFPVYGHLGRGTPRSMNDPRFAHKLPQEIWIEFIDAIH